MPKTVDTAELNYLKKEDYGKVPAYLGYVKEEIKREQYQKMTHLVRLDTTGQMKRKEHLENEFRQPQ